MKKLYTLVIALLITVGISAQDDGYRTIFDNGDFRISGFGGPFMNFSSFNGEFVHMMGGGGGIMVGDFFFGGYGLGSTNNLTANYNGESYDIDFGHGGLWFGYSFLSNNAIHPAFHIQTGWGSVEEEFNSDFRSSYNVIDDKVFVLNPTLEMEFNFTHFFRMGIGGHYRMVFGSDESNFGFTDADLSSPGAYLAFKFGWF